MRRRWGLRLALVAVAAAVVAGGLSWPGTQDWFAASVWSRGSGMSHGPGNLPGVLDDGDLGNYVRYPPADTIVPAFDATRPARQVAGDAGDVVAFRPDGAGLLDAAHPMVVHRVLLWVAYDAASGRFDVPALGLRGVSEVTLPSVGSWEETAQAYVHRAARLVLVEEGPEGLRYPAGQHSGWVTKADKDNRLDQAPRADGSAGLLLVQPAWVEAKLTRVVDAEGVVIQVAAGVAAVIVAGVVGIMFRGKLKLGRGRESGKLASLLRSNCDCGAVWQDLAFCARCGAERYPANRYSSPEAMRAARLAKAERRR